MKSEDENSQEHYGHAHHIRCFRKHGGAKKNHMCYYKVPPVQKYVHIYGLGDIASNQARLQRQSLPDVMKDVNNAIEERGLDVTGALYQKELCKQCRSILPKNHNNSSSQEDDIGNVNILLIARPPESTDDDDNDDSTSPPCNHNVCSMNVEPASTTGDNGVLSDEQPETQDVFLTKTSTGNDVMLKPTPTSLGRHQLLSDNMSPRRIFRLSR